MYSDFLFHTLWTQSVHVVQEQIPLQTSLSCLWISNITGLTDLKNIPLSHISSVPNYVKMLPHWLYYNNEPMPSWFNLLHPAAGSVKCLCMCGGWYKGIYWYMFHECTWPHAFVQLRVTAAPPVVCCPLTFSNILKMQRLACQGQCTSLLDYEALPFINMPRP